jgi:parallel beta-helix repeat protein
LNYSTIQGAIDAPETSGGNTIVVDSGTYYEHLTVSKPVFLVGESRNDTIIDGSGSGPVVTLSADNITVANFTIRNAGNQFSPMATCVFGNNIANILMENNTLMNASNGIIFYACHNSSMNHNLAEECTVMGLHFDTTVDCIMTGNTVNDSFEGIVLEKSAGNLIQGNLLMDNNVSMDFYASVDNAVEGNDLINNSVGIVLDSCNGTNSFRNNSITGAAYNLLVWGPSTEAFVQNIDTSNSVDNRTVYYIVNSNNSTLNPISCPNVGYLALVNCTRTTVKDIDLSDDKDGMLMVQSTYCSLVNITLANMHTNLTLTFSSGQSIQAIQGGLTLFQSGNNSMTDSRITNNSIGICLYQSNGNLFYDNSFVDINEPVISNFQSPTSAPSGSYSVNEWNNDLEGNYWSSYNGTDTDKDGIGDTPYIIDQNNTDQYPLMGEFHDFSLPTLSQGPQPLHIISNSTISSLSIIIWLSSPYDGFQPGQPCGIQFIAAGENGTVGFCRLMIPRAILNSSSFIVLVDSQPVNATVLPISNSSFVYLYFTYSHSSHEIQVTIPEFSSIVLPLFMIVTLVALWSARTKHEKSTLLKP